MSSAADARIPSSVASSTSASANGGWGGTVPDGKVVVVGSANDDFTVVRLNADGTLDTTFGLDGRAEIDVTGGQDLATAVAFGPGDKIVVAGYANGTDFGVIRLNDDGSLDTTFSGDGKATITLGFDAAEAVAVDAFGRVVVGGETDAGTGSDFMVVRFTAAGLADPTFGGGDGIVTTDFAGSTDGIFGIAIQPDGKIVASGRAFTTSWDFGFARYLENGDLDPTFGTGGKTLVDFGVNDEAHGIGLTSDGKIVAGGRSGACSGGCTYDFVAARLNADGTLDTSFDSDGKTAPVNLGGNDLAYDTVVDASDRVVLAGSSETAAGFDWGIVRFTSAGVPDPAFGAGGIVSSPWGAGFDRAYGVDVQADGKYVVAGPVELGADRGAGVARFEADAPAAPTSSTTTTTTTTTTATTTTAPVSTTTTTTTAPAPTTTTTTTTPPATTTTAAPAPAAPPSAPAPAAPPSAPAPAAPPPAQQPAPPAVSAPPAARFTLRVARPSHNRGLVRTAPRGLYCGMDCTAAYAAGTAVVLEAIPSVRATFTGWTGACSGVHPRCIVTMDGARSVSANFVQRRPSDPVTLSVTTTGNGAAATWEWGLANGPVDCGAVCVDRFRVGSRVRLVAVPRPGFRFAGWGGGCSGTRVWCELAMTRSRQVHARFTADR